MKSLNLNIRDLLFSSRCSLCRERHCDKDPYLCYNCYNRIVDKISLRRKKNLYYLTRYDDSIKRLISAFKLKNRRYIGSFLGGLIREPMEEVIAREEIDLVIPVPVSMAKRRSRGYNQVEDMLLSAGITFERVERIRNTDPMHSLLDEKLRKENVSGSFKSQVDIAKKNILIVDDIVTTGSTVRELIRALEMQGKARKIIVFTFALANTAFVNDLSFERE